MKKVLFIFLVLTLALSACGPEPQSSQMHVQWTNLACAVIAAGRYNQNRYGRTFIG